MNTLAVGYVIPAIRAYSGLTPVRQCSCRAYSKQSTIFQKQSTVFKKRVDGFHKIGQQFLQKEEVSILTHPLNSLYKVTEKLYELKEQQEHHLCNVTDDLFNIDNKLMLFDLTNFYFEGSKRNSNKAKFGRSKEKRSDCKLLVLALCITIVR